MEKIEKKEGIFKGLFTAIKALGTDYSTEDIQIAKEVEEIEKLQKQIHEEQKEFGASLRVKPAKTISGKTKKKNVKKEKSQDEEIIK